MRMMPNPYTPGAGHAPPHLAGRTEVIQTLEAAFTQERILKNPILTGLRGLGKTVLLADLKPRAEKLGWAWVSTELSESVFVSEEMLARRILTDLSLFTSAVTAHSRAPRPIGLGLAENETQVVTPYTFAALSGIYESTPGLPSDKLRTVLERCWPLFARVGMRGLVFAYDEAQVIGDHVKEAQYPLSLLLQVFQSLQAQGARYMLILAGLPTLYGRLVAARTYSERMFATHTLKELDRASARDAIVKPLRGQPVFSEAVVEQILDLSGGYPYFLQFICREVFEHARLSATASHAEPLKALPVDTILAKLDADFFAGRWAAITDRLRDFLMALAASNLDANDFSHQEAVTAGEAEAKKLGLRPFQKSSATQCLGQLVERGLLYRARFGRYCFAVPMFRDFIVRQLGHTL